MYPYFSAMAVLRYSSRKTMTRREKREMNKAAHREMQADRAAFFAEQKRLLRERIRSGPHEAIIRRRELFTDEEAAEELGCTVDELLRMEQEFIDPLRRKWMKLLGYACLVVRMRRIDDLIRAKENGLEAW